MTVADALEANADRHYANARRYLDVGNKEYAQGSLRKGDRNLGRATMLREAVKLPPFLQQAVDAMADAIARTIMQGDSA